MKSKLLIIFMVLALLSAGQVPNTTIFTLQNVVDVISPNPMQASPIFAYDIQDCFGASNPDYFNTTYKAQYYAEAGSRENLLMFRDYGSHNSCSNFYLSSTGSNNGTTGTSFDVTMPAASNSDFYLIVVGQVGNTSITTPDGYSVTKVNAATGTSPISMYIFYKYVTATTSGHTVSISTGGTSSDKWGAAFRYTNSKSNLTAYDQMSSGIAYTSATTGAYANSPNCGAALSFIIIRRYETPSYTAGTGWSYDMFVSSNLAGGWGLGVQRNNFTTSENIPDTQFSFTSSYYATITLIVYN